MKFSTRARYGLRMMVELARALQTQKLVHLGKISKVTGVSVNYLAQLAIPLKSNGLILGVSGKRGGYQLAKPADQIRVNEVLEAVQGLTGLTDCVSRPHICLNSEFCEARILWVIASNRMMEVFEEYTLADLIDPDWKSEIRNKYASMKFMHPETLVADDTPSRSCPARGE